ncbi:protein RhiA, partial [Yersinia pestis PY-03]
MSNTLDLSAAAGTPYQVKFVNHSSSAWTVFLYQKMPNQPSDVFSLAWQASPFKV